MFRKEELSATKERWNEALESTPPQTEVVMETPLESRQLDFGNWIKQDLMARERGKVWSPRMKSDTEEEWGPHAASVPMKAHIPGAWGIWEANLSSQEVYEETC